MLVRIQFVSIVASSVVCSGHSSTLDMKRRQLKSYLRFLR